MSVKKVTDLALRSLSLRKPTLPKRFSTFPPVGPRFRSLEKLQETSSQSRMPANVYGYAAIVAYALHQASAPGATPDAPGTGPLQNLTAANFENPLVILIVSMVIGALAGYLSGQLAKVMTRKV